MQSVIVYHNPVQESLWEAFMASPFVFPCIVSAVVFIAAFVVIQLQVVHRFFGLGSVFLTYLNVFVSVNISIYIFSKLV